MSRIKDTKRERVIQYWSVEFSNGKTIRISGKIASIFEEAYYEATEKHAGLELIGIRAMYRVKDAWDDSIPRRRGYIYWVFDGEKPDKSLGWFYVLDKAQTCAAKTHNKGVCRITDEGQLRVQKQRKIYKEKNPIPLKTGFMTEPPSEAESEQMYLDYIKSIELVAEDEQGKEIAK